MCTFTCSLPQKWSYGNWQKQNKTRNCCLLDGRQWISWKWPNCSVHWVWSSPNWREANHVEGWREGTHCEPMLVCPPKTDIKPGRWTFMNTCPVDRDSSWMQALWEFASPSNCNRNYYENIVNSSQSWKNELCSLFCGT